MLPLRDSIPSSRTPFVNVAIIGANLLVFIFQMTLPEHEFERFVYHWSVIPAAFNPVSHYHRGTIASLPMLITSMFLHGNLAHVGFNMLFLWVFGDNVEDTLGHIKYFLFYLACGIVAAAAQIFFSLRSTVPMIGASGAIGGVMGAYLVLYPQAKVLTFFWFFIFVRFFWVSAFFYLGLWFVLQFIQAVGVLGSQSAVAHGGVAVWAHVGGFAAGAVAALFAKRLPRARTSGARGGEWPYS